MDDDYPLLSSAIGIIRERYPREIGAISSDEARILTDASSGIP
jgi:hypothetical protein